MYVRVCGCVYVLDFQLFKPLYSQAAWDIDLKFSTAVKHSVPFNRNDFHAN